MAITKMYHPAFKEEVGMSGYADPYKVKEPWADYWLPEFDPPSTYPDHYGFDAYSLTNWHAPIFAVADGVVAEAVNWGEETGRYGSNGSGNYVAIETAGCRGCISAVTYKHLYRIDVVEGQVINKGDQIGLQGKTGNTSGEHLHMDLFIYKKVGDPLDRYDPYPYLIGEKSWVIDWGVEYVKVAVACRFRNTEPTIINIRSMPDKNSADLGDIPVGGEFNAIEIVDNPDQKLVFANTGSGYVAIQADGADWVVPVAAEDLTVELAQAEATIVQQEADIAALELTVDDLRNDANSAIAILSGN